MPKRISVFGLLLVLVLVSVGGVLHDGRNPYEDPLLQLFEPGRALTFEGALAIAERLDSIGDQLEMPPLPVKSNEDMQMLAFEIVPYYFYDGIAEGQEQFPLISWGWMQGEGNFHVLGRCTVGASPSIKLNFRYRNPYSSWYAARSLFSTLVHEIGHAEGIYSFTDPMSEPATQLATVEILAAMSRDRNVWAVPAFVREVQRYADNYAYSLALQENRLTEYRDYRYRIADDIYDKAAWRRSLDHWADNMGELKRILKHYGEQPYILLVKALADPGYESVRLTPLPNEADHLVVDDTAWVLAHLYEMARDYPALLAEFQRRAGNN